jgi:hypothetical protein
MAITNPAPASGLLRRFPRLVVLVDGTPLPHVLEATTTRGLDQDVATATITVPHPLPDYVRMWSKVQLLIGVDDPDPDPPYQGLQTRFTGYVTSPPATQWPPSRTLQCEDVLSIAKYSYPRGEQRLTDETDRSAVELILEHVGYSGGIFDIGAGTGRILGDIDEANLFWEEGTTALAKIQEIDSISLGWRTYGTAGGRIARSLIDTDPNTTSEVWWFNEGVDAFDASMTADIKDAKNEITVTGFGDVTAEAKLDPDQDPYAWWHNSYWLRFKMLQARVSGTLLNTTDQAAWILSQLNKNVVKVTFTTHLGILFTGQEVIGLTSERLEVDQRFWVQSVQTAAAADGSFSQTITAVSELDQNVNRRIQNPPIVTPSALPPGVPAAVPPPRPPAAPTASDLVVSFGIDALDKEMAAPAAVLDDHGTAHYTLTASDTSTSRQGRVASRAWAASGPGVTVASGSGPTFTTSFTSLAGATITLTVTDSHGFSKSKTLPVQTGGTPLRLRKLYSVTDTTLEAFDGSQWRSATPGGPAQVVGAGPYWGAGSDVYHSADDLQSPPTSAAALAGGEQIKSIWVHERRDGYVAVGGAGGSVAVSHDHGATWEQKTAPPGGAVNFIIVSINDYREIHAVTPAGWYKSQDEGQTWDQVRAGSFVYLELAPARNIVITSAGQLQNADTGTPFTGPTAPIVAATAHIRSDQFYAIAADGSTWVQAGPGRYAMTPYPAGAYRDGTLVDLVYFAAQDGGLFKTLDGFRSAEGYLRLRASGLLTP